MFRTHPVTVVRIAAIALIVYYLLNLSSEAIKVSSALQQRQYLLRDLVRYFLLLFASIGFIRVYQPSLGRLGKLVLALTIFTSIFGIVAYLSLSLNLFLVPQATWQTSLLAFFEFLKAELGMQFQQFVNGRQSMGSWIANWFTQFQLQFLPQASDFPTGRGWIKLYLLFKLLASTLLKVVVVLACTMFLFSRPLLKHNLLIGSLILLWLLSPIFGTTLSILWAWLLQLKAVNGEAIRNLVALIIMFAIALRMWIDAATLSNVPKKRRKKTTSGKSSKTKTKKAVRKSNK